MENNQPTYENMANYYVLPLLSLNKRSFGVGNFINSFVSDKGEIVVKVNDMNKVPQEVLAHPNYVFDLDNDEDNDGTSVIVFTLPVAFADHALKFREGKFSQFSDVAKSQIRKYSGLRYKAQKIGSKELITDDLLLALDKDPGLRARREAELSAPGSKVNISADAELMSKPSETNFIII